MARKHKHEEHENHERWLVSYADFITLLFAFFVVMYSVSRVDNKKMAQAAQSIRWALHMAGNGGVGELPIFDGPPSQGGCSANLGSQPPKHTEAVKAVEAVQRKLEKRLKPFLLERKMAEAVTIQMENGRLTIRLAAGRFFDPAQAALRPDCLPVIDAIGAELKTLRRQVRVEAHTDDSAISTPRFRNNWDLSAGRASSVASLLEQGVGIEGKLLAAAGMGAGRPLVPNTSAENRELNRRVEMVVEVLPTDAGGSVAK